MIAPPPPVERETPTGAEAMREAVARAGFNAWYVGDAYDDFPEIHRMWLRVADAILAGPIASELTRLRADAARHPEESARKDAALRLAEHVLTGIAKDVGACGWLNDGDDETLATIRAALANPETTDA